MNYPRLTLLLGTFIVAYVLHAIDAFEHMAQLLNGYGYVSMLLAGLLFSFGFTAAFGVAIMIDLAAHIDPFLGAIIGGMGAMLTDIGIFSLVRFAIFHEELHRLRATRLMRFIQTTLSHPSISERMRKAFLWSFAGMIIASPLPDEFGVMLIGSATKVQSKKFAYLCFILNTIGIFLIIQGARLL